MKKVIMVISILLSFHANGQEWNPCNNLYWGNFDEYDASYRDLLIIDTINYHHNIWQVGAPHKIIFDSAYSPLFAIVTDTLNQYPANDTSVFIIKMPFGNFNLMTFGFSYKLDKDSGSIARLELRAGTGNMWYDVKDTLPHLIDWITRTDLSSSVHQWTTMSFGNNLSSLIPDTISLRFTFISGTVAGGDGWIIDNFYNVYWCEAAAENVNIPATIAIQPIPSSGNIYISGVLPPGNEQKIIVYNMLGQQVYVTEKPPVDGNLNLRLPTGFYILKYYSANNYHVGKFEIVN